MPVGNDVVDLRDEAIAYSHLRPRFVSRVLTPGERARFAMAEDPKALLWAHFAAKEAAYKAVSQVRPPPGFAFQRFEVAADFSSVRFEDPDPIVLRLRLEATSERVHAVAWLGEAPELVGVEALDESADPSAAARLALCSALSGRLGCGAEQLSIVREKVPRSWDGFGPPRLVRQGARVPARVSLSHDGRFVAHAARLERQPRAV